ncbi:hypothetical protein KKA24_00035, partial [Patescibacteria group bacterium]|nr:hypothetical protein [Patescibacteria group bacterium]
VRDLMSLLLLFLPAKPSRSSFALGFVAPISPKPQSKFFVGGWTTFYLRRSFQPPNFARPTHSWGVGGRTSS